MKFKSLKYRLFIKFGSIFAAILLIFSIIFYLLFWQKSALLVKEKLFNQAEKIETYIEDKKDLKKLPFTFAIYKGEKEIFKSQNFKKLDFKRNFFMPKLPLFNETAYLKYFLEDKDIYIIVERLKCDDILENILTILAIVIPLLFLLYLLILNNVIKSILEPIIQLNNDAKIVNINNFKSSLAKTKYNDEIALLRDSFNEMIYRLKSGVERLKKANDTIAHELKTPISVIKGEIELALNKKRDNKYYEITLQKIYKQLNNLESLIKTLLLLSRYSKEEIKNSFEPCDFNAILIEVLEDLENLAKQKNISIELREFQKAFKDSKKELVFTIFRNLIENAIKYSQDSSKVEISLSKQNNKIIFKVKDWGVGIKKEDIDKLGERFFKAEHNNSGGFGLGLSIVQEAVTLLSATMEIKSKLNKGSEFIVYF